VSSDGGAADGAARVYRNALHLAVEHDAVDVVKLLLRYSVDPESRGAYSHQPPAPAPQQPAAAANVAVVAAAAAAAAAAVALDADNNIGGAAAACLARYRPPTVGDEQRAAGKWAATAGASGVSANSLGGPLQHALPKSAALKGAAAGATSAGGSPKSLSPQKYGAAPSLRPNLVRANVERVADAGSLRGDAKESGRRVVYL